MQVLVVDDQAQSRALLGALLTGRGHGVVTASDGIEALDRLSRGGIEVVVSDILMPRMDGYRLCQACKEDQTLAAIPFILMTDAFIDAEDESFARSMGADSFIRAPVDSVALIDTLDAAIVRLAGAAAKPGPLAHDAYLERYSERIVRQLERKIAALNAETAERERSESRLRIANRALRMVSEANGVLVHATGEEELLQRVCDVIIRTGGYRMAWVGFAQHDEDRTIRPMAYAGYQAGYLERSNISWADNVRGRGATGTAMRTGVTQVNQNFATNPRLAPWREEARKGGYGSSIALALRDGGVTFATLTIYSAAHDAFDADEVALLEELAANLAFGIVGLRARAERDRMHEDSRRYQEMLRKALEDSVQAIATTVELRDQYTAGHQRRVAALSVAIARELGLPPLQIEGLHFAASIHDIGKNQVPAELLTKPGRLSALEYELMKCHAQAGYDIVKEISFPWPLADIILQHHERLDGSGYPRGLKGGEILPEAKILAVADVVEALSSHRPYRPAHGIAKALDEIATRRGVLYDAAAADACLRLFAQNRLFAENLFRFD